MSINEENPKEYLTVSEVAEIYGKNNYTIREWAAKGLLIATKIGREWLFPKDQFTSAKIVCPFCNKEITGFRDELSLKEAKISGLCQHCQDVVFKEK